MDYDGMNGPDMLDHRAMMFKSSLYLATCPDRFDAFMDCGATYTVWI